MNDAPTGPLASPEWLREHLRDPHVRVVDFRWYLAGRSGANEFSKGHIPGAVFVDLDRDLTPPDGPGRHPIPGPEQLAAAMSRAGVANDDLVVAYDDAGGSVAARLWWLLSQHGHARVQVLDGGLAAWTAAGGALEAGAVTPAPSRYVVRPSRLAVVDRHAVEFLRQDRSGRVALLDARAPDRYRGDVEPVDARPGHIPGARSAPWAGNLGADGRFLPRDALRARYRALGVAEGTDVVCYCGSGVTACHDVLALALAGIEGAAVRLYEGSWSDWARDPHRPAALGDEAGQR